MVKKYKEYINESIRDMMTPKTKSEISQAYKKVFNLTEDYIEVKIDEPIGVKKMKLTISVSDRFNIDLKDYDDGYILVCGEIYDVIEFIKYYQYVINDKIINIIRYIKDNKIIPKKLIESIRDKMIPKSKDDILKIIPGVLNKKYTKTEPKEYYNIYNGIVRSTYDKLIELFGNPKLENWTPRMNYCWYLLNENNDYIEIYDWNNSYFVSRKYLHEGEHTWDIKSKSSKAIDDIINYISFHNLIF